MFPFQDNWFFKLTAKKLKASEMLCLSKKHSFRLINTRVYYPGKHAVGIQVNGQILAKAEFESFLRFVPYLSLLTQLTLSIF